MANNNPFSPTVGTTKTLSATNSSGSVTLDAKDSSGHSVLRLYNAGPALVFIRWGTGAQTAVTTDMPLVPGVVEVFSKAYSDDTVAGITASSTATVYISSGEGL